MITRSLVPAVVVASVIGVVVLVWALGWVDFGAWKPDDWSALAAWVTAAVAVAAGWIALGQLGEARRLRLEQAQPYVVLFMEPSAADPKFIDLVVRNLGATAARDVELTISPTAQRSLQGGGCEDVWLPTSLPVLVPNQEWRTFWDFTPERSAADLPNRYEAQVAYKDSQGKESFSTPSVLDWSTYKGRQWMTAYGLHDIGKAAREINKTLGKWQEDHRGGLAVFVRDGAAKDERQRERMEALRAQRTAEVQGEIGEEPKA